MNIFLHEIKSLFKNTAIWAASIIALAGLYLSVYPGMMKDAEDFKKLLEGYPPSIRAMLGINLDDFTSLLGFYAMIFSFIVLCGAIQAMNLGLSVLSKESREKTADFLLVKPVSRCEIVSAKLFAAFTAMIGTNIVFNVFSILLANLVKTRDFSLKLFFMINLTLFFVQLIFFAVGLLISVFFNKLRSVLPISLGTVFGLYFIGALLATKSDDFARYLSPFKYFDPSYIIRHSSYETSYMITGAVIIVVSIAASYFIYSKKDIHAVS